MTPHRKLFIANVLMLIGITPLCLGVSWVVTVIVYAQQHRGAAGGSDAFLMIAVLIFAYLFAAVLSGASALWSMSIERKHADAGLTSAKVIKGLVGILLGLPIFGFVVMRFLG